MTSKKRKKKNPPLSWQQRLKQRWNEEWKAKAPVLIFLAGFGLCVILFYIIYYSTWYEENLREHLLGFQARLGGFFIQLLGYQITVDGESITGNDFAMSIKNGCDGLEATILYLAAILVFPLPFKLKMPGLIFGFTTLFVINILRIVGLYAVGVHWSSAFEFFHVHGGLILFSFISISLWMLWIDWAFKKQKRELTHAS